MLYASNHNKMKMDLPKKPSELEESIKRNIWHFFCLNMTIMIFLWQMPILTNSLVMSCLVMTHPLASMQVIRIIQVPEVKYVMQWLHHIAQQLWDRNK